MLFKYIFFFIFSFYLQNAILPNEIILKAKITLYHVEEKTNVDISMSQIENEVFYVELALGNSSRFATGNNLHPCQHNS